MLTVTFWNSDFAGDNYEQLCAILCDFATRGCGCWFYKKTNFITAGLPSEDEYVWIMEHVANYGNKEINK